MTVKLALAEQDTQVVSSADFNYICIAGSRFCQEILFEFLVSDVIGHHDYKTVLIFYTFKHLIVPFHDAAGLPLRIYQFSYCLDCLVNGLLVDVLLCTSAVISSIRRSAVKPVEANGGFIETDTAISCFACSFARTG